MKKDDHAIFKQRGRSNIMIGLILFAFVALVFGISIVKVANGTLSQAPDHVLRPEIIPQEQSK